MSYRSEVLADSPVGYYEMETSAGVDSGSGNRTLTLGGDIVTGVSGKHGFGWEFDGVNDYSTTTSFPTLTSAFTFEAWIKSPSSLGLTANEYPTIIRRDGTDIVLLRLRGSALGVAPGQAEVYIDGTTLLSVTRVDDGLWHHLAYTQTGSTARLYMDGVLKDTKTTTQNTFNFGTGVGYVGSGGTAGERYQGTLDEVAIYNTALSAARILAHYNAPVEVSKTYAATPATVNVSSNTPTVVLNEIIVNATPATVAVSSPDAIPVITWDGPRTETVLKDEFTPTSGPWGSDWIASTGRFGEVTHTSSGGRVDSKNGSDDAAYAISVKSAVGELSLAVDVIGFSPSGTRVAWGLVTEVPSLKTSFGDPGWTASEGILVGRTGDTLVVTGPSDTVTYSPPQAVEKFTISGRELKTYTESGTLNATYTIPIGAAPSQPLRVFIGAGELLGSTVTAGVIIVNRVEFSNTRRGVIYTPTIPTVNISTTQPSVVGGKPLSVNVGVASVSVSAVDAVAEFDNNPYSIAVLTKGPQAFYKAEDSGKDSVGTADLTLSGVAYSDGITRDRKAFLFDGDSYATSSPAVGQASTSYNDFTVEAWINTSGVDNHGSGGAGFWENMGIIAKLTDTGVTDGNMAMAVRSVDIANPGGAEFHLDYGGANFAGDLDNSQWHHMAVAISGNQGYAYVDGNYYGYFNSGQSRTLNFNNKLMTIGTNLVGSIDNIAVYPRVLSLAEIQDNYNVGMAEVSAQVDNIYYTAAASTLNVSVTDVTIDTIKSIAYPAQSINTNVNASGHGWHVQRTVSLEASPSVVNVTSGNHVAAGNFVVTVNATPVTIELDAINAQVLAADSVSTSAESVVIDVTSLDARGGDPNKNMLFEAVEAIVLTPNGAYAVGGHDEYVSADITNIDVSINEPSVSNMTDVLIQATQIGVKIKLVGFYNREEDEWADWVEATTSDEAGQDVWHRFHETGGTVVYDETTNNDPSQLPTEGIYYGSPTYNVSGMLDDRTGVRLNGGPQDFIVTGVPSVNNGLGYSQELWFRTIDTGLLLGAWEGAGVVDEPPGGIEVTDSGLRVFVASPAYSGLGTVVPEVFAYYDIPVKVNDGQWHQVLWFQEDPINWGDVGGYRQWTLMVDGEVRFSRTDNDGALRPLGGMDMTRIGGWDRTSQVTVARVAEISNLNVDVMEFINRSWSGFTRDLGARSYRIMMGHTIIDAPPVVVTVSGSAATRAKGNRKKMLVIDGAFEMLSANADYYGATASSWSGVSTNMESLEGYDVFTLSRLERTGTFARHLKPSFDDRYYDDYSGAPRFLDLEKDLAVDITEFDVIHVLHWPGPYQPNDFLYLDTYYAGGDPTLIPQNYERARQGFIATLMYAVNKGVGLWIANPQQAVDMGIAESFEGHSKMIESGMWFTAPDAEVMGVRQRTYDLERENEASQYWDLFSKSDKGRSVWNVSDLDYIRERVIVSEAEGFSEYPTSYVGETIHYEAYQDWTSHNSIIASNNEHRPNGLKIGTKFTLNTGGLGVGGRSHESFEARGGESIVYTLTPNNIRGQVIAKEQPTILMGTEEVENPWKDNVTTVLLERGTLLNGKPIGGRIFVETQDDFKPVKTVLSRGASYHEHLNEFEPRLPSDDLLRYFGHDPEATHWDNDVRFYPDKVIWATSGYFMGDQRYFFDFPTSGDLVMPEGLGYIYFPYFGMNQRGLKWLGVKPEEEFGRAMVYPEVAKVTVDTKAPEVSVVRHGGFVALPAEVRVEFRKPTGLADPDVQVNVAPVRITVIGGSYQRIVSAGVATITVTGTFGEQVTGSGEDYVLYLRNEDITLYLGED